MLLTKTIKDGQAVIAWNYNGTREIIQGPKTILTLFKNIYPVEWATAREGEYLAIEYKNGTTEHKVGPCKLCTDPLLHQRITTHTALNLDAHEAVVIYDDQNEAVTHRILNGPAVYVPAPTEWLHDFQWHGDNGKGKKVPRALKFQKLRVIPDQLYFDVDTVRTADEALITVKLMVFFELVNIEQMLKQTHDPIADFINALGADVIRFVGMLDFETFKNEAEELNEQETYQELTARAERIGYRINKVVYRGYDASTKLQAMHDDAIEMRTRLALEKETEEQQQELTDLKQDRQHHRAAAERQEAERLLQHDLAQKRQEHEEELKFLKEQNTQELLAQKECTEQEIVLSTKRHVAEKAQRQALLELKFQQWRQLHETGADLTAILVAEQKNPDKTIRLEQSGEAELHLHEAV